MKEIKLDTRQITKALIIIATVLTLIYTVHLMTSKKEKNTNAYFSSPNATNQKIMTVNQSTGEINFLDKSVQATNDDLVNDYATIKNGMKLLLGDNFQGSTEGKIFETDHLIAWLTSESARVEQKVDDLRIRLYGS